MAYGTFRTVEEFARTFDIAAENGQLSLHKMK
jgi:hypothetical protein